MLLFWDIAKRGETKYSHQTLHYEIKFMAITNG